MKSVIKAAIVMLMLMGISSAQAVEWRVPLSKVMQSAAFEGRYDGKDNYGRSCSITIGNVELGTNGRRDFALSSIYLNYHTALFYLSTYKTAQGLDYSVLVCKEGRESLAVELDGVRGRPKSYTYVKKHDLSEENEKFVCSGLKLVAVQGE